MIKKFRVLVADSDQASRRRIADHLEESGFAVDRVGGHHEVLGAMYQAHPDLILLEWSWVDPRHWNTLAQIRTVAEIPVVLIAEAGQAMDLHRVEEAGANACLTKPIDEGTLLARVREQLGVAEASAAPLRIDWQNRRALRGGHVISLSKQEFELLELLARQGGRPVSAEQLGRVLWKTADRLSRQDNLKHYIWRLRKKLEVDPHHPEHLQTVRGAGYRLSITPADRAKKRRGPGGSSAQTV